MNYKKPVQIISLLFALASKIYSMENLVAKYENAQAYLKEHFTEKKGIASLQEAQIIALGQASHASPEVYERITNVVNSLEDAETTFLIEGLERGKLLDFKTKQWGNLNSSVVTKGCDLSAEKLDEIRAGIGAKLAACIARIQAGQKLDTVNLGNDDEIITQRNKEFIAAINDELTAGKKVLISFGAAHYDKLPEAKEFQDFLASKKSCVYFTKENKKTEAYSFEESHDLWLKRYIPQP